VKKLTAALCVLLAIACGKEQPSATGSARAPKASTAAESPAAAGTEVGDMMPGYAAPYLKDASTFRMEGEKGNVVFVNVWATWCGPCRMEIPELQQLHDKYQARGFKVVGVSIDDGPAGDVKSFVAEEKITYPIVLDQQGHLANVLQTTVLPTSVLVDRTGRIVWRKVGAVTPNELPEVESAIEKALKS
jgi:thiol-disulfide isomerase/thioredoxin